MLLEELKRNTAEFGACGVTFFILAFFSHFGIYLCWLCDAKY